MNLSKCMVCYLEITWHRTQLATHYNAVESQCKWVGLIPWYNMQIWILYHSLCLVSDVSNFISVKNRGELRYGKANPAPHVTPVVLISLYSRWQDYDYGNICYFLLTFHKSWLFCSSEREITPVKRIILEWKSEMCNCYFKNNTPDYIKLVFSSIIKRIKHKTTVRVAIFI